MSDLKFKILNYIYNSPNHKQSKMNLLNSGFSSYSEIHSILQELEKRELLYKSVQDEYGLTGTGMDAIEEAQETRAQYAENKRQHRFNNKLTIIAILTPFVLFILGLIVDHFPSILSFLSSLFSH